MLQCQKKNIMERLRNFRGFTEFLANAEYAENFTIGKSTYMYLGYVICAGFVVVNAYKILPNGNSKLVCFNSLDYVDKIIKSFR